jgi:hypothetical protein
MLEIGVAAAPLPPVSLIGPVDSNRTLKPLPFCDPQGV